MTLATLYFALENFYLKFRAEFKGIEVPNDAIFGALEKGHELPAEDKTCWFSFVLKV